MPRLIIACLFAGFVFSQVLAAHPATNAVVSAPGTNRLTAPVLTNAVAAGAPTVKKAPGYPFRGKLAAVDPSRSTIQIGKSTYWITPQTKITKDGKAARLSDGVIGEPAVGYARKASDGRAVAASLRFGPKVEAGTPAPANAGAAATPGKGGPGAVRK